MHLSFKPNSVLELLAMPLMKAVSLPYLGTEDESVEGFCQLITTIGKEHCLMDRSRNLQPCTRRRSLCMALLSWKKPPRDRSSDPIFKTQAVRQLPDQVKEFVTIH